LPWIAADTAGTAHITPFQGEDVGNVGKVLNNYILVESTDLGSFGRGLRVLRIAGNARLDPDVHGHRDEKYEGDGHHPDKYRDEQYEPPYQEYPKLQRD
jgi:hypothetical protein